MDERARLVPIHYWHIDVKYKRIEILNFITTNDLNSLQTIFGCFDLEELF